MLEHNSNAAGKLQVEFTKVCSADRLTKRLSIGGDGKIVKDGAAKLNRGAAHRVMAGGSPAEILQQLGSVMLDLRCTEAIICAPPTAPGDTLQIRSRYAVDQTPGAITRTRNQFTPPAGPALLMLDFDTADFPVYLTDAIQANRSISDILEKVHPAFKDAACLFRYSASSNVKVAGRHEPARPTGNHRYYVVDHGDRIEEFVSVLADRLIAAGFGWGKVAAPGNVMVRSLFDVTASKDTSRLCFEADAEFADPRLSYAEGARASKLLGGSGVLCTAIAPLTDGERAALSVERRKIEQAHAVEGEATRAHYVDERIKSMIAAGVSSDTARKRVLALVERHELAADFELVLDDGSTTTVREILQHPLAFHRKTLPDPLEPDYNGGSNLAIIYSDRHPVVIHSRAHGDRRFVLVPAVEDFFEVLPDEPAEVVSSDGWPEPIDIFDHAVPSGLDEPPACCLPSMIEAWARSEARRKGVPMSFAAMAAITAIGAAIGSTIRIQVRQHDNGFIEPAALWSALIARPGSAKSAIVNAALRPLQEINAEWLASDRPRYLAWERQAKKDKPVSPPKLRHLLVDDVTMEKQVMIHADNPRGIMRATDELAFVFETFGAYKKAGGGDRAQMLRTFDGGSVSVSRVASGDRYAETALMGILAGTQPDKMREVAAGLQSDGLLQRFLFVIDGGTTGAPIDEAPDGDALAAYRHAVRYCVDIGYDKHRRPLKATAEAHQLFRVFISETDKLASLPGMSGAWGGHIGKWEKFAARIVLIFHALDYVERDTLELGIDGLGDIEPATTARALRFCRFLLRHSLGFYMTYMGADPSTSDAMRIAGRLLLHPELSVMKPAHIYQSDKSLKGAENRWKLRRATEELSSLGWIRPTSASASADPDGWHVNPLIHERFKARAAWETENRQAIKDKMSEAMASKQKIME